MERLKNMSLKKSFFYLAFWCVLGSVLLVILLFTITQNSYNELSPLEALVSIRNEDGTIAMEKQTPNLTQKQIICFYILHYLRTLSCVLFPCCGLGIAGVLFYRIKLKEPISILKQSAERIQNQDLDFSICINSQDEMGQLGAAFETMRAELLKTNQKLWQQTEERKRLNTAFAHDLRNPVTVLKGTVQLIRHGIQDEQAVDRMETYVLRIEQYVEAMSSIQKLEHMPIQKKAITYSQIQAELEDTANLFAAHLDISVHVPEEGIVQMDHGIFLNVAENLITNASRFAKEKLRIQLEQTGNFVTLSVIDDGTGFPAELVQNGPKPFGKMCEENEHFGMGLYSSKILCMKHGGTLHLDNVENGGAKASASFQIKGKS